MKWVLLLESSEVDREYLSKVIYRLGYSLFRAQSAQEALRFMNQSLPDALVVGERIPDHDPIELGRLISEDPLLSAAPRLLLTSTKDQRFHEDARQAGYSEIVQRPMSIRRFFTSLEMCLSGNRRLCIRAPISVPVQLKLNSSAISLKTHNFGEGGLYVPTPDRMENNTEVDLGFRLPGLRNDFNFRGRVVHTLHTDTDEAPEGMGFSFVDVRPAMGMVLKIFMENYLAKPMAPTV